MRFTVLVALVMVSCAGPPSSSAQPTASPATAPVPPSLAPVDGPPDPTILPPNVGRFAAPATPSASPRFRPRSPSPPPRSRLIGPGLDVAVGIYRDCTGQAHVDGVELDVCYHDRVYFVGHNPGLFTPLVGYAAGTRLDWWDAAGRHRVLTILRRVIAGRCCTPPLVAGAGAQLQTCAPGHPDGSRDLYLDASLRST
jgi:hypothetical protein